jgi:serine/threonine-protein kinase HipA
VAPTQVLQFDGARCLVVTRFDRHQTSDGTWRRIHQEDALQALGKSPQLKYEQNGGPGVREVAKLLRNHVTGGRADTDVARFIDAVAFNWLVAGADAHARNYSLLHTRTDTRLAPLYDENSFLPYADGRRISLAMKLGFTERDPHQISRRDFDELARDCHVDAAATLDRVDALAQQLLAVVGDVVGDPSLHQFASDLPARFGELLVANVNACRRRL